MRYLTAAAGFLMACANLHSAERDGLSLLFLGDNGHHRPGDRAAQLIPVLAERGIDVKYTDDVGALTLETLNQFDGLIIYANTERISPAQEQALLDYVAAGHGRAEIADAAFETLALAVLCVALGALGVLIADVWIDGASRLSWEFLSSFPSRRPEDAGIRHALAGSIFVIALTGAMAVPIGVAAAIYLEEYGTRSVMARIIEINITNLAAVPSIIYGLLGLGLFVRAMGMGRSVMAGASTLALLVLPVVILSTREALRAVPKSIREGSYALGATKWQTIWHQVLPVALPGMLTGTILALSRAIGETAPLITIGALTFVAFAPDGIWSPFTVLPIQIFNWVSRPQPEFRTNAAAAILVLLALLLTMNAAAIWLRDRYQKRMT